MPQTHDTRAESAHASEALVYFGDRTRLIVACIASFLAAIVVTLSALVLIPAKTNGGELALVMSLGVLLFGSLGVIGVFAALDRRPLLVATHQGLTVNHFAVPIGLISWADVDSLMIFLTPQGRTLVIRLRSTQALLSQRLASIPPRMWLAWLAIQWTGSLIFTDGNFRVAVQDIVEQIQQQFEVELRHPQVSVHHRRLEHGYRLYG